MLTNDLLIYYTETTSGGLVEGPMNSQVSDDTSPSQQFMSSMSAGGSCFTPTPSDRFYVLHCS